MTGPVCALGCFCGLPCRAAGVSVLVSVSLSSLPGRVHLALVSQSFLMECEFGSMLIYTSRFCRVIT